MRRYGLLGAHLTHSFSPQIHACFGNEPYLLFEKEPEELDSFLKGDFFDGINVTIPYKKAVMSYCASLSERAKRIGSVNTLLRLQDGSLYGENTDYDGFLSLIQDNHVSVQGKKAIVLGSGGASLTVQAVLEDLGAGEIVVISRGGQNNYQNLDRHADANIIVNTTPVGMYPHNGEAPVPMKLFSKCYAVFDLIYNPSKTALLLAAEEMGIPAYNGLRMLVAQAVKAGELFRSESLALDIGTLTEQIGRRMRNLILIGMPGCGKSTIGAALARMTNRDFADTDTEIEKAAGMPIPAYFKKYGEEKFRLLETEVLAKLSSYSGYVIATGGGIVTQERNLPLLRQNSTVIFLNRDLRMLETAGRPISQKRSIASIAEERMPNYLAWSDLTVECTGVHETAAKIRDLLS